MFLDCRRGLCHLHQGYNSLLHSGAARAAEQKHRETKLGRTLNRLCDFLTHDMPHARHHKPGVTYTKHDVLTEHLAASYRDCLFQTCLFPCSRKLILISFIIKRIADRHILEPWLKAPGVCNHTDTVIGLDTEIPATLIAYVFLLDNACAVDHSAALRALNLTFVLRFYFLCLFLCVL